jgi:hypothetical protein
MITIFQNIPRIQVLLVTEHRNYNTPMNDRKLTASKGINNPLEIQILNSDRKPADLTDKTIRFTLSKIKANNIYLDREIDLVVNEAKGLYKIVITGDELYSIPPGLAQLAFYVVDEDGNRTPLFKNISGGYTIDLDIIDGPYVLPVEAITDDYGSVDGINVTVEDYGSITDPVEITET